MSDKPVWDKEKLSKFLYALETASKEGWDSFTFDNAKYDLKGGRQLAEMLKAQFNGKD